MAKEGRKTKDAPISDNFNPNKTLKLNRAELARAKRQATANAKQAKKDDAERRKAQREKRAFNKKLLNENLHKMAAKGLEVLEEEQEAERQELEREAAAEELKKETAGETQGTSRNSPDEPSAYQMLQDMRYVYRKVKGRKKLAELIEADDKQFVFMVKELMKIESQLMSAKIRAREDLNGTAQQTVFVVLKGLEDGPQILDVTPGDEDIDHKQIAAALTPEGAEYEG